MSPRDPETGDFVRRAYRLLLAAYPRDFRRRYEADLLQSFDDRRAEPRFEGTLGGLRLLLFLLRDVISVRSLARDPTPTAPSRDAIMNDVLRDLRYTARMLVKTPVFTVATIATLALGIGLNTATFSAINGVLLRPLAGTRAPENLVQIYRTWPGMAYGSNSVPHYQDLRDRTGDAFESMAAWYFTQMALSVDGRSERIMGMMVSANLFQTYGAGMTLGRPFLPDQESVGPGAHPVVVLGHGFWQTRFGGDPEIVGRSLILNGQPFEVVGVASADFRGPVNFADVPLYVPLMMQPVIEPAFDRLEARGSSTMNVVGRLRDGVEVERAAEAIEATLLQLREEYPSSYDDQLGHTLVPQNEAGIHPSFRNAQVGMSAVIMSVVALLLLIACLNVANLFLARARERRREIGIRLSLGAGRRRIVQQLLTESLVFGALGGLAGLGLAALAVQGLVAFRPPMDGPWYFAVDLDSTALSFTLGVSLMAGVLFGLAPALQAVRPDTAAAVKAGADDRTAGSRMSRALVVAQMALSLILLISSGLFLRSLQSATEIDPGFDDPRHLVMASVDPAMQGYGREEALRLQTRLLDELAALPEVVSVGTTSSAQLGLNNSDRGVEIPGYDFAEGEANSIHYAHVSEGYLEAMGIDVLEGRTFTRQDDADGAPAIIVNRAFAERFWPGASAVGRVVRTAGAAREVVGVVETGKYQSLGEAPRAFMFLPQRQAYAAGITLVARTPTDPQVALQRIRDIVRAVDPDMPVFDVRSMEDHMGVALLPARLGGSVLGIFGLLGLGLAAVGIYGVMAYSVAQRKRELGIRVALGADRGRVVGMVVREGLRLAVLGTVIGLVGAALSARLVSGMLYNVRSIDPVAFLGVPTLLVLVAALAVYLPARRAAAADPMRALKAE